MSPRCSPAPPASLSTSKRRSRASRVLSPESTTIYRRAPFTWSARWTKPSPRRARWPPRQPEARASDMPDRVQFELVTPERLLISEAVEMVVVPGTEGNFGVLPGHALLISTIRPGAIEVYEGQRVTRRIFVAGGFADVTPERCTVLADDAD